MPQTSIEISFLSQGAGTRDRRRRGRFRFLHMNLRDFWYRVVLGRRVP